jgi:hypothetical protein
MMWQTPGQGINSGKADASTESRGAQERKGRFDVVDLFEELLSKRAELGFRPILFVSSERDLECNLIGMFESEFAQESEGEAVPSIDSVDELRRRLQ